MNFLIGFATGILTCGVIYVFWDKIKGLFASKLKQVEAKLNPPKS